MQKDTNAPTRDICELVGVLTALTSSAAHSVESIDMANVPQKFEPYISVFERKD